MTLALASILGLLALALHAVSLHGCMISLDGERYLTMARGLPVPRPFHLRWLLPLALGEDMRRWLAASWASAVAIPVLVAALVPGSLGTKLTAAWLVAMLPIVRLGVMLPALTDMTGMALALGSAVTAPRLPWLAVALALVAGCVNEKAPIFAAVYAWSWLPLAGGALAWLVTLAAGPKAGPSADPYTGRPLAEVARTIWQEGRHDPLSWRTTLLPWGLLLPLAALGARWDVVTLQAGVALVLAHAQLAVATDNARLTGWAAPAVALLAARGCPETMQCLACVMHAFNPYRGV